MREVEIALERRAAPDAPRLDAAMVRRRHLDEVRIAPPVKQQGDIAFETGLVAFDGKAIVGPAPNEVLRQVALRQQGIGRDHLAGDLAAIEQGDRPANLVGALLLIASGYGQGAHFFGVWQRFDSGPITLMMCACRPAERVNGFATPL